jgi:hypothetical protein
MKRREIILNIRFDLHKFKKKSFKLQVTKLKMWPYFDVAHCIMACLAVREDLGTGKY